MRPRTFSDEELLRVLPKKEPGLRIGQIAVALNNACKKTVRENLNRLIDAGAVSLSGNRRNRRYYIGGKKISRSERLALAEPKPKPKLTLLPPPPPVHYSDVDPRFLRLEERLPLWNINMWRLRP